MRSRWLPLIGAVIAGIVMALSLIQFDILADPDFTRTTIPPHLLTPTTLDIGVQA